VSALGAAHLAGRALGVWASDAELGQLERQRERFEPQEDPAMAERYSEWKKALARTLL